MDLPHLLKIAEALGSRSNTHLRLGTENISISCPFAGFIDEDPESDTFGLTYHSDGVDSRPSMSIRVNPNGRSVFKCWTCGFHGTIEDLLDQLNWRTNFRYASLLLKVHARETALEEKWGSVEADRFAPRLRVVDVGYSEEELKDFTPRYLKFLRNRGVSEDSLKRWELLFDEDNRRVVFPVRNQSGLLVGAHGRKISRKEYRPVLIFETTGYLYGEHLVDWKHDHIIVVEGQFDAISLDQRGYNVVALMGKSLGTGQLAKLMAFKGEIILLLDGDDKGRTAMEQIQEQLPRVLLAYAPDGKDPDEMTNEEIDRAIAEARTRRREAHAVRS